jgi:hypothetical protein
VANVAPIFYNNINMKITFTFSRQYENAVNHADNILTYEKTNVLISQLDAFWSKMGPDIEKMYLELSGLHFISSEIQCYINSQFSISDPFSIRAEDINDMKNNIIHELVHVLLIQNEAVSNVFKNKWNFYYKTHYQSETPLTRTHIPIHAIHYLIAKKYMPDQINRIKSYTQHPDYLRSWQIVDNETPEIIVTKIFR